MTPIGTSPGNGWIHPPGALANPPSLGSLPVGYRTKYVSFANVATADIALGGAGFSWLPLNTVTGQPQSFFVLVGFLDDECIGGTCKHDYYNLQGVVVEGAGGTTELLRGNMQGEYR